MNSFMNAPRVFYNAARLAVRADALMVHMSQTGQRRALFPQVMDAGTRLHRLRTGSWRAGAGLLEGRTAKKMAFLESATRNRGTVGFNLMLRAQRIDSHGRQCHETGLSGALRLGCRIAHGDRPGGCSSGAGAHGACRA